MTSIIGIRCTDGVVVGADGSATFVSGQLKTIEQPTEKKIQIIGDRVIVAGSGYTGHMQRFCAVVQRLWGEGQFKGKSAIDVGKMLCAAGIQDFLETNLQKVDLTALVAFPASDGPTLCELHGPLAFQPDIKEPDDLWYVSCGSGQPITDPFLGLLRSVFWTEGPPNIQGGIFTVLWALNHACELNPGGIKEPIKIAVLALNKGRLMARILSPEEIDEHDNMVSSAAEHMARFRDVVLGKADVKTIPKPKAE